MYEINFDAITTNGEVVENLTIKVSEFIEKNIELKRLGVQRLCVEYARLMNVSCSFADIKSINKNPLE